jgi:phosphoenolpyruvate phosphomutase
VSALRALLSGERIALAAGAHDAVTARLAERHGFDAVWASGLGISAARGVPDTGTMPMAEMLAAAKLIEEACALPIIADCDTGFGDADDFANAVREYERAGIAGVCIEDQAFPKRNSLDERGGHQLVPVEEFSGKLRAGKQAQASADFVVIARVEAFIAGLGEDEAHERATAYGEAGADAILIHSRARDAGEIAGFARRWDEELPLVAVPSSYPGVTTSELEELGVRLVIYANQALRAAVKAIDDALGRIRADGSAGPLDSEIAPVRAIFDLQD